MFEMSLVGKGFDIETLSTSREEIFSTASVLFLFLCVICHCFPELDRRLASHRWEINMSAGKKASC